VSARIQTGLRLIAAFLLCFHESTSGQDKKPSVPLFRVDVETVYVKVTVSDPLGRYVTGLEKEHFKVYEDNVEQTISHFSQESAPISLGFVFDISGSMGTGLNVGKAKNWFIRLLEIRNPDDEYALITFNTKVNLVQAFTSDSAELQNDIAYQKSGGRTALYDAVYRGLDHVREGKNDKKALILVSDGEDNSSRYRATEVRELSKESDVQIYAIGLVGPEGYGQGVLNSIARITGGRAFFPSGYGADNIGYYIDLIHTELRNQYLLGYVPSNRTRDGNWRQIKVKLDAPRGFPKLAVRNRDGYYAGK
jgi:Ca-activated chloride channel homolog